MSQVKNSSLAAIAATITALFMAGCASDLAVLQKRADAGDPVAQWQLADCMMNGTNECPKNPAMAKQLLEKSISSENPEAVALKGEFIAYGRYGQNPDIEKALQMMEPAVLSGDNRRISYGFLKVVFANRNYNHFKACAQAIENAYGYERDSFTPEDHHRRWELALMFQKELRAFMQGGAYDFGNKRLKEQKEYMGDIISFLSNGARYNHEWNEHEREYHRADERHFQPEMKNAKQIMEVLNRTIEVEGVGANAADCTKDAQRKAVEQLCGIKVTSSAFMNQSENVNNEKVDEKSSFRQDVSSQVSDNLESFSIVEAPKIQPNGLYKGLYRAVAKPEKKK